MPIPDTLTKIRITGDVRHPLSGAPGTGTVEFVFGYAIRDTGNHVIFAPGTVTATVTAGVFTTDEIVNPRQSGISPSNQLLTVRILTDVYADEFRIEIPADSTGTLRLSSLAPAESPPAVVTYALASALGDYLPKAGGTVTGAVAWNGTPSASGHLVPKAYVDAADAALLPRAGGTLTGAVSWNGTPSASGHLANKAYVDAAVAGAVGEPPTTLPLFNVEDYGAVGDGTTDDYTAVRAAWDAMLASPVGGLLYFPRAVTYRVVATLARIAPTVDQAYALFPLPMVTAESGTKKTVGVLGVGDPYVVRAASSFGIEGAAQQVATATVLHVDYSTPFTWHASRGHPAVFGAPDADATGHTADNIVTNLHVYRDGVIYRQPDNPSMANWNMELVSTQQTRAIRHDVVSVLDDVVEPTHPTGVAELAPKSNNNVANVIERFVAEGYYAALGYTEHCDVKSATVLRCKIAVHNRRVCSHFGKLGMLKLEQCPFQLAGYDPSGVGPNLGVVPWVGGTVVIDFVDVEHFAYTGTIPWIYPPVHGCDIYAPNGGLSGSIRAYGRVNSEPLPINGGIGIAPLGAGSDIYVRGNTDSGLGLSGFGIYDLAGEAITVGGGKRHLGTAPSNPPVAPPNTPTIGVATAGVGSVSIAFTAAGGGEPADDFTATAYDSGLAAVGSATGASSPIQITGLTAGVAVTVKVRANNTIGSSAYSTASNPATPTSGVTEYRLLPATNGPSDSATDAAPINLGVEFKVTTAAAATKLHFYRGNTDITGPVTGKLFEITGVGTGTAVPGTDVTFTLSGTGWHAVEFTSPIALSTSVRYAAVVHFPDRWPVTAAFWVSGAGSAGITNGPLTAHNTATSVNGQGVFGSGALAFPGSGSGSGANYWVDVTVVDA